ncbi:MAG TPA: hypothetical protein PL087_09915 [Bacteroidales bacterium]|nr:hypothetical protein [Bacteroidales bacterium]
MMGTSTWLSWIITRFYAVLTAVTGNDSRANYLIMPEQSRMGQPPCTKDNTYQKTFDDIHRVISPVGAWLRQWQRRDHILKAAVLIEVLNDCETSKWRDRAIGVPDVKICIHQVLSEMNGEDSEIRHLKKMCTFNELIRLKKYYVD